MMTLLERPWDSARLRKQLYRFWRKACHRWTSKMTLMKTNSMTYNILLLTGQRTGHGLQVRRRGMFQPRRKRTQLWRIVMMTAMMRITSPLCVRIGGAITSKLCLENLQSISMEDTVHDASDTEPQQPPVPEKHQVQNEGDIVGQPASITNHLCLKRLAEYLLLPIPLCTAKDPLTSVECRAPGPFSIQTKSRGTAVIMQWICPNNHCVWQWNSQPTFKYGMQAGDLMLASNILLSGNNYAKVALLFKFMNMGIVERSTFFRIQDQYCVDTIKDFWNDKRAEVISRLHSKNNIVGLADGRMDSPGFCAQYCTYTVMENDTKEMISVVNIDKWNTQRNSVIMEREGFVKSFDKLCQEVKLTEMCTDAHTQISALFNKEWIQKGSVAHEALSEIVLNERWLQKVHKYLHFRSMAELESFHNHILMYASKRFSFSPPVYEARILLAALDYNHHVHRQPKRRPDGSIEYRKLFNKKSKDYKYIADLQRAVVRKRLSSGRGLSRQTTKRPDDPPRHGVLSGVPALTIQELLETQVSRGDGHTLPQT